MPKLLFSISDVMIWTEWRFALCKVSITPIVMIFYVIQQFSQSGLSYHLLPDKQQQNKVRFNLHYPG